MCQNTVVHKFSLLFLGFLTLPASAAGLGFNPFEKGSPTSPGGAQNSRPANPSSATAPKPPSPVVAPQPKPASPPANSLAPQQTKK
jgi:hypothetical protein